MSLFFFAPPPAAAVISRPAAAVVVVEAEFSSFDVAVNTATAFPAILPCWCLSSLLLLLLFLLLAAAVRSLLYLRVLCVRLFLFSAVQQLTYFFKSSTDINMKGASAIALLASMAGVNAFVGPAVVSHVRPGTAADRSSLKMSAERKAPGDVKLDQGVMDRQVKAPQGPTRT